MSTGAMVAIARPLSPRSIHYRPRSAIRDVGKALGLTEDVTAALARHGVGQLG